MKCSAAKRPSVDASANQRSRSSPTARNRRPNPTTAIRLKSASAATVQTNSIGTSPDESDGTESPSAAHPSHSPVSRKPTPKRVVQRPARAADAPELRTAAPESAVVVLTASGTEDNLMAAIRAGAAGYLLKTEPPERLVEFLRGLARGEAALSGSVATRLLERVREGREHEGGVPDRIAEPLSAREVEVLLLLDDHLGTDEIAERLFISEHTVRSHVKSLLHKLGVSSRREALEVLATARA